jgi:hypothetical protein
MWSRLLKLSSGSFRQCYVIFNSLDSRLIVYRFSMIWSQRTKIKCILTLWSMDVSRYILNSMTSLLTHTVAHSTMPSFRLKTNNQPLKKLLSLAVSWVKVVKNGKILTFKVNFLCQKLSESFYFFFIEEFDFRGTPFVNDIFWKLQFLNQFIF